MTFKELKQFITEDMRMQHIYQPMMLIELLKTNSPIDFDNFFWFLCTGETKSKK